jgi:formylglycine-generating enzyme required for sulfatase activity/serine/threonine protein kinase
MATLDPSGSSVASLFEAWLARRDAGEKPDFEALCRAHPAAEQELRQLHDVWHRLAAAGRHPGVEPSLAAQLETRFGTDVDPQITLESEEPLRGDVSSAVLSRLAGRGPASTRYRVKGEIAHGGMGAVLRVWDEDLHRHLAMKVMLAQGVTAEQADSPATDPSKLARFLEEAQVTGQLDHPGIVPVHELGLDAEGGVYFTMKLVRGKTLKEVFDELDNGEGGWTQTRVLGLILKVCEAMSYAHAKGVIHRDLKPANIMVGKFGEVYVMDWGVAKVLGREDRNDIRIRKESASQSSIVHSYRLARMSETPDSPLYTMEGDVVGTPAYMPPEQAKGDLSAMGPHSDVYAVGAMLYHLLAGHMPYAPLGAKVNNYAVWGLVQQGPPPALDARATNAPAELAAICSKAMAREPSQRYAEMSKLAEDLSAYIEGRVVSAYETGAWAETRKWVQRNKPLAAALVSAVLLLVVGLVSSLLLKGQSDANAERADGKAAEAERNLTLAQNSERDAQHERARAEAETAKVLRLSDVKVLQQLLADADALWPPHPERIPALDSWAKRARALADNLPEHRQTLADMRDRAQPWSSDERAQDRATHPKAGELAKKQAELDALIVQLDQGVSSETRDSTDQRIAELEPEVASLAGEVEARRTWSFASPEDQWQHDVLAELVQGLRELADGLLADDAITPNSGWSVPKRLSFARQLQADFGAGGACSKAWAEALPGLRKAYPGLDLKPQMGLLPIGPDPTSGLWEFAHLMTGEPAERGPGGQLVLTEQTGIVLVLLRGGSFWMGAQASSPGGRNYDPQALEDEVPVHAVELSPFFMSKYEWTQAQWMRLTGRNPSHNKPGSWGKDWLAGNKPASLLHPVEQISWTDCMHLVPRAGLSLPSEAQWEYAARAGTSTPWWTGADKESLTGAANVLDGYAQAHGGPAWRGHELWLDDGATDHAPIGAYAANAFGLHDTVGSLWELCLDGYFGGFYEKSPKLDPIAPSNEITNRVSRGGSFTDAAFGARCSNRNNSSPDSNGHNLGVRPARAIDR